MRLLLEMPLFLLSPGTERTYVNGRVGLLGSTAVRLLNQSVYHRTGAGGLLLGTAKPRVNILRSTMLNKKSGHTLCEDIQRVRKPPACSIGIALVLLLRLYSVNSPLQAVHKICRCLGLSTGAVCTESTSILAVYWFRLRAPVD